MKVEWGGDELSCVLLCCCQDFIWWTFILMQVCIVVATKTFVHHVYVACMFL